MRILNRFPPMMRSLQVIQRDIPRTYPELEFFKDAGRGQSSLFNVIKAYSIHDKEVGYCQGSAFIVGQLLLQVCSQLFYLEIITEKFRVHESMFYYSRKSFLLRS